MSLLLMNLESVVMNLVTFEYLLDFWKPPGKEKTDNPKEAE